MIDWGRRVRRSVARMMVRRKNDRAKERREASGEGVVVRDQGSTLVETALSISILLTVLIGIMQLCMVMYSSTFIAEAAREATRYASVRGANSCTDGPTMPNCNMNQLGAQNSLDTNPLQTYVRNLGYPIPNRNNLTVTANWWLVQTDAATPYASNWTTPCTGSTSSVNQQPCNQPGNAVSVTVNYSIPLYIPFWKNATVNLTSTSRMVIAN